MDGINDIRIVKTNLRQKYKNLRQNMPAYDKKEYDHKIFKRLITTSYYKKADTILCFVSTKIEVDTLELINKAFEDGKSVAVPKCINQKGKMNFYFINSLNELEKSTFNLLEPNIEKSSKVVDFTNSICILPGFAYDRYGYRIGYGKGYYDRFLNKYSGKKIGVCYDNCMIDKLPHGKYDVAADVVVTQVGVIKSVKIDIGE